MVKQRIRYERVVSPLAIQRIKEKKCPSCDKPRTNWVRHRRNHLEWKCCSSECTTKFYKEFCEYNDWSQIRFKAFERDDYTCKECGVKKEAEQLIADHIIPIALGGEEFNLSNVQTLCLECNKTKTVKDLKGIAKLRRKEKVLKQHKPLEHYDMRKKFLNFKHSQNRQRTLQNRSTIQMGKIKN